MNLHFFNLGLLILILLLAIVILAVNNIELVSLPEFLSGLSPQNLLICRHFVIMVLEVLV
jgi:hypothetical protein